MRRYIVEHAWDNGACYYSELIANHWPTRLSVSTGQATPH